METLFDLLQVCTISRQSTVWPILIERFLSTSRFFSDRRSSCWTWIRCRGKCCFTISGSDWQPLCYLQCASLRVWRFSTIRFLRVHYPGPADFSGICKVQEETINEGGEKEDSVANEQNHSKWHSSATSHSAITIFFDESDPNYSGSLDSDFITLYSPCIFATSTSAIFLPIFLSFTHPYYFLWRFTCGIDVVVQK